MSGSGSARSISILDGQESRETGGGKKPAKGAFGLSHQESFTGDRHMIRQRGLRGRPGWRRQRMGGPGIGRRPAVERQWLDGPEYSGSPSVPDDLQASDVSSEREGDEGLGDFPTNVRVVTVDEFDEASFDPLAPLIVKGAVTRAGKKWADEWLRERFGTVDCQVNLDSRLSRPAFRKHMTLDEYLDSLAKSKASEQFLEYVFQPRMEVEGDANELLEDLDVPAAILDLGEDTSWWLTVGPALAGTLPHYHRSAINVLARGRKRWAIYVCGSPGENRMLLQEGFRDYSSGSQAKDWFVRECPKLRSRRRVHLWECAQEAGDLLYVPAYFIHGVVNLEPVVGFSIQFFQRRDFARLAAHRRGSLQGIL